MESLDLSKLIPLLVPIIILQLGLQIYALVDLSRQPRVRWNNKWIWVAIIILLEILGPVVYFLLARKEE